MAKLRAGETDNAYNLAVAQSTVLAKTVSYTLKVTDQYVVFNATTLTATLPTAVGHAGLVLRVKNLFNGNLTVATTSSQTVDGTTPAVLAQYAVNTYVSDGTNWYVF
jgi:hypothetical protein